MTTAFALATPAAPDGRYDFLRRAAFTGNLGPVELDAILPPVDCRRTRDRIGGAR